MPILLLKSLLSLIMLLSTIIAMFTMFEVFGRSDKRFIIERLKKVHRVNGIIYVLIFIFIAYFCLAFITMSKAELSSRSTFHSVFAIAIIVLLCLKISFIRIYRQFYGKVQALGVLIALITFGLIGTSGGYYLLVSSFGTTNKAFDKAIEQKKQGVKEDVKSSNETARIRITTDLQVIERGKRAFNSKCSFCHDPYSTGGTAGPGLKAVLKAATLPSSKRAATPENIRDQLKQPFGKMPSFAHLQEDEIQDMIAFMNTL